MMKNLKQFVQLCVMALLLPVQALAAEFTVDGISYSTTSAWEVEVVRYTGEGDYQGEVTINATVTYDGVEYRVTGIGNTAISGPGVASVSLPAGTIRTIKDNGFLDIRNVTTFTVPASVTEIGANAFKFCDGMTDFYFCSAMPPSVASTSFANMKKTTCVLHVPTGSKAAYQAVAEFNAFTNIEEWDAPEVYGMKIAGCIVTEANASDVFENGKVRYSPQTTTLTIGQDVITTIDGQSVVLNEGIEGLTIELDDCSLLANQATCLHLLKETTLRGHATIESDNVMPIYCWAPMVIQDATISFNGPTSLMGSSSEDLMIKNSNVSGAVPSGSVISGFNDVVLTDCYYQMPVGATYKDGALLDSNGSFASSVSIKAGIPNSYELWVAGTQVTDLNCADILEDGAARYDPANLTLTIGGDITAIGDARAVESNIEGKFCLNIAADVKLMAFHSNAIFLRSGTISGEHQLSLMAPAGFALKSGAGDVELSGLDIQLDGCLEGICTQSNSRLLTLRNISVSGSVNSGNAAIAGYRGVRMIGCYYVEPIGPRYEDHMLLDIDGNPASTVKIEKGSAKYDILLSFPRECYMGTIGESFTAPELNNIRNVSVDYASSNTNVATVDSKTGEVAIKGKGVTVISATYAGDELYYPYKVSYYLVVTKQAGLQYDVNGDGKVSITDAVSVVNAILNGAGE